MLGSLAVVRRNGSEGSRHAVAAGGRCVIGRAGDCHVRVQLENVAERHCAIHAHQDGQVYVSLLSDAHTALLDDKPLPPPSAGTNARRLHNNSHIKLAGRSFIWNSSAASVSPRGDAASSGVMKTPAKLQPAKALVARGHCTTASKVLSRGVTSKTRGLNHHTRASLSPSKMVTFAKTPKKFVSIARQARVNVVARGHCATASKVLSRGVTSKTRGLNHHTRASLSPSKMVGGRTPKKFVSIARQARVNGSTRATPLKTKTPRKSSSSESVSPRGDAASSGVMKTPAKLQPAKALDVVDGCVGRAAVSYAARLKSAIKGRRMSRVAAAGSRGVTAHNVPPRGRRVPRGGITSPDLHLAPAGLSLASPTTGHVNSPPTLVLHGKSALPPPPAVSPTPAVRRRSVASPDCYRSPDVSVSTFVSPLTVIKSSSRCASRNEQWLNSPSLKSVFKSSKTPRSVAVTTPAARSRTPAGASGNVRGAALKTPRSALKTPRGVGRKSAAAAVLKSARKSVSRRAVALSYAAVLRQTVQQRRLKTTATSAPRAVHVAARGKRRPARVKSPVVQEFLGGASLGVGTTGHADSPPTFVLHGKKSAAVAAARSAASRRGQHRRTEPSSRASCVRKSAKALNTQSRQSKPKHMHQRVNSTPHGTPQADYSQVAGLKRLMQTPGAHRTPKADYTKVGGLKKLMQTPGAHRTPQADYTKVGGLKKLMQTPGAHRTPQADYTKVGGLKKLMQTPGAHRTPQADYTKVGGLKKLMQTPGAHRTLQADYTKVGGLKKLMQTPGAHRTPQADYTKVGGLRRLMQTPGVHGSPQADYTQVAGVKRLLGASVRAPTSPAADYDYHVSAVQHLFTGPLPPPRALWMADDVSSAPAGRRTRTQPTTKAAAAAVSEESTGAARALRSKPSRRDNAAAAATVKPRAGRPSTRASRKKLPGGPSASPVPTAKSIGSTSSKRPRRGRPVKPTSSSSPPAAAAPTAAVRLTRRVVACSLVDSQGAGDKAGKQQDEQQQPRRQGRSESGKSGTPVKHEETLARSTRARAKSTAIKPVATKTPAAAADDMANKPKRRGTRPKKSDVEVKAAVIALVSPRATRARRTASVVAATSQPAPAVASRALRSGRTASCSDAAPVTQASRQLRRR